MFPTMPVAPITATFMCANISIFIFCETTSLHNALSFLVQYLPEAINNSGKL